MPKLLQHLSLALSAALLWGCAATPQSSSLMQQVPEGIAAETQLDQVPFFPQEQYQCGPAALATVLLASDVAVTPQQLVSQVYVPGRQGSFQAEMMAATRNHGRLAYELAPSLEVLLTEINAGHPVLVLQNLGLDWYPQWHFAVVKGYDLEERQLILNSGTRENYALPLSTFERTWARAEHWAMVALPPDQLPASADSQAYFQSVVALERSNAAALVRQAYEAGLDRWPHHKALLMAYGNLLYGQGALQESAQAFRKVIDLDSGYAPAYNNLAQVLYELDQGQEAIRLARQAVKLGGEYAQAYRETLRRLDQKRKSNE